MKRKIPNPAWDELKRMVPAFFIANALIFIGCAVYSAFQPLGWLKTIGSVLLGDLLMAANFWLCGVFISKTVSQKNPKRGQLISNGGYAVRYIGLFLIYGAGLMLGLIHVIPAFLPLFIPRLYYTAEYLFNGKKYGRTDKNI